MEYETPQFYRLMSYAARTDRDVIDMVSGSPDWDPPDSLREALHEYADLENERFDYPSSHGIRSLREAVAARRGVDVSQVLITNGAGEANYLAMARAMERDAGSEILLVDPVYPYYPGKATLLGASQRFVETGPDGTLDPAAVRAAASAETAAIVVNTPNNPTGAVYDAETIAALVDVAEEHDALLVSDEVYDHFDRSGAFASALAVDSDHRIVTNAFSKSLAITGFRVGYAVFPPGLVDAARTRHMLVNVTGSRPAQYAVSRALEETGPDYYAATRERLRERVDTFTGALEAAGVECTRPDGGFYVLARFEGIPGTLANAERLIDEAGVAGMPGETFGDACADWFRFALLTPRVEEAAERLVSFAG